MQNGASRYLPLLDMDKITKYNRAKSSIWIDRNTIPFLPFELLLRPCCAPFAQFPQPFEMNRQFFQLEKPIWPENIQFWTWNTKLKPIDYVVNANIHVNQSTNPQQSNQHKNCGFERCQTINAIQLNIYTLYS